MTEKEQLWYARFLDYTQSGLSRCRWCKKNNLPVSTFRYWCRKFSALRIDEDFQHVDSQDVSWYEISCRKENEALSESAAEHAGTVRLQFRDLKMELPAGTDSRFILQIVGELVKA